MNSKGETDMKNGKRQSMAPLVAEQTVVTYVTVPPDGGWGWVVVAASFFCNLLVDGYTYSVGVFLAPVVEGLGVPRSTASLMGSLLSGFCLMSGPFVSALANRYGFRIVAILGSVVACVSFVAASQVHSIELLCITYGILGGIGLGLIYVPAVITTGFYFEKWRALATGIAVTGSGIGTFILPPLIFHLITTFGWRGAILIQAGLILNCAVFGALFRPLLPVQITVPYDEDDDDDDKKEEEEKEKKDETEADEDVGDENRDTVTSNKLPLLMKIRHAREELKRTDSNLSFDNEVSITAQPPPNIRRFLKAGHNNKYATVREVLHESRENVQNLFQTNHKDEKTSPQINNKNQNNVIRNKGRFDIITYKDKKMYPQKQKVKLPDIGDFPDDPLLTKHPHSATVHTAHPYSNSRRMSTHRLAAAAAILEACDVRRNSISLRYRPRARTMSEGSTGRMRSRRATVSSGVRPFYRDDIFFQASPRRLPQYKNTEGPEYTMAVTRLPTFNDVLEEETATCTLCPEAVQRTLATMLDFSLLTSPTFLILSTSGFITMMGFFIPFMYLQNRATDAGMDKELAKWLLSTIGIANTIGRIICGIVSSLPNVNALVISNISLSVGGIATILSGLSMSDTYQFGYAALFGLAMSGFASLRSILIVDLIGLEKLTNGFGLLLLFQGVAAAIGSPIAGYFKDMTGDYGITFALSGGLILFSGVMCYPLNWINKWENERNSRLEAKDSMKDQVV